MKTSDRVKHSVITELIKKSEPAVHAKLHKWMDSVQPKQDRFDEDLKSHAVKRMQAETYELYPEAEWNTIKEEMQQIKRECEDLIILAKTFDPKGADVLSRIANAFRYIHIVVPIDHAQKDSPVINFWDWDQQRIVHWRKNINKQKDLQKKKQLFSQARDTIKVEWEIFIESEVRKRLSWALDQPELHSTIGDNLKAIREHPNLPKSIINRIEKMFHLQFMVIGSKLRFMTWETIGSATGDMGF
jgi:hypothetical protein